MTIDEARRVLAVDASTRGPELRRAYLRKVKAHPPDRDPEAFKRVRDAFELLNLMPLQFAVEIASNAGGAEGDPKHEASGSSEAAAPFPVGALVAQETPFDSDELEEEQSLPDDPTSNALRAMLDQPNVSLGRLLDALDDASRAGQLQGAWHTVECYLWEHVRHEELPLLLAQAYGRQLPGLELPALLHAPDLLNAKQLWELVRQGHQLRAEWELSERGDPELHRVLLERLVQEADDVSPALCIRLVLGLISREQLPQARSLLDALDRYLDQTGSSKNLGADASVQRRAAVELLALPAPSASAGRIMAAGVLHNRPETAHHQLNELRKREPQLAKLLKKHLRSSSPVLQQMFGAPPDAPLGWSGRISWIIIILILSSFRRHFQQAGNIALVVVFAALMVGVTVYGLHRLGWLSVERWRQWRQPRS